jgi:CheY-like chemotaxis protein
MKTPPDFIVIDDDPLSNLICRKVIKSIFPEAYVETFLNPETALDYLSSTYQGPDTNRAVIFLDIDMPILNGWKVLDRLNDFPDLDREKIKMFMLSTSINPRDSDLAKKSPIVTGYITKAITQEKIRTVLAEYGLLK